MEPLPDEKPVSTTSMLYETQMSPLPQASLPHQKYVQRGIRLLMQAPPSPLEFLR